MPPQHLAHSLHQPRLGHGELGALAQFQIIRPVLGGRREFGAEDQITDRRLALIALVGALDNRAGRAATVGVFELSVHAR